MATVDFTPAGDPTDAVAELSLAAGTAYTIQNVDSSTVLRVREAAAKPATDARAHLVKPGEDWTVTPETGLGAWCWTSDGSECSCVVTESP